jgi:hypothetical protein
LRDLITRTIRAVIRSAEDQAAAIAEARRQDDDAEPVAIDDAGVGDSLGGPGPRQRRVHERAARLCFGVASTSRVSAFIGVEMNRSVAGLCVAALAVAAAGCGDDDERLSSEEFLEQGNAICASVNDELDAAFEELGDDQPSTDEFVSLVEDTLVPIVRTEIDDLRELNPPEELEDEASQLFDDADAVIDEIEQMIQDDPEAFVESDEDLFAEVNERATELGLVECGDEG